MRGRVDLPKYNASCQTLRNFLPTIQGAALKRSGTKFVKEVPDTTPAYSAQGFFQVTTDGVGNTQTISLPFDPTVVVLWGSNQSGTPASTEDDTSSRGFFGFSTIDDRHSVAWRHRDGTSPSQTFRFSSSAYSMQMLLNGSDAIDGAARITSMSGGFTLKVLNAFATDYVVRYWAFRIPQAKILTYDSPASTGADQIGPLPFTPDSAMFFGAEASGADSVLSFGVCAGTSFDQYGMATFIGDGDVTLDADHYVQEGESLLFLTSSSGPEERGTVTGMSGGYIDVNWAEVTGSGETYAVLAMDSGGAMEVFDFSTTAGTGDVSVTSLSAKPLGSLFFSIGRPENTADTAASTAHTIIGGATSAGNQGGFAFYSNTASSVFEASSIDHVFTRLQTGPTIQGSVEVTAVNSDGYTLNQDDADGAGTSFVFGIALTASTGTNSAVRLIPFKFNATDAHVLEFGNRYMAVYTDQGIQLETAQTITGATQADPVQITLASHGYQNGDSVFIDSVGGMTEINDRYFTVENAAEDTFDLSGEDGTGHTAYTSGGTAQRVYAIATPYSSSELSAIQFDSSADVVYLAHPSHPPMKLSRIANANWTLEVISFDWPPFRPENNDEDEYIVASAATGEITLTSTGGRFTTGHVGGHLRLAVRYESLYPEWAVNKADGPAVSVPGFTDGQTGNISAGDHAWYEGRVYRLFDLNGHGACGTLPPTHEQGIRTDGQFVWEFVNPGSGYVKIDSISSAYRATGTVVVELSAASVDDDIAITSISSASPPVLTTATHGYETGDRVWIQGMTGDASVFNNAYYTITVLSGTTFSLDDQVASGTGTGGEAVRVRTTDTSTDTTYESNRDHDLWNFSAFSEENGYPRSVAFFEDRLYWGGTDKDPQTLWGSVTGEYEDHLPSTVEASGALRFTLATGDPIEWLLQQNALMAGLAGAEFASPRDGDPLVPDNVHTIRRKSAYGSKRNVRPVLIENQVLLTQRSGRELREVSFDIDSGDFSGANLALLAEHLTLGGIAEIAFQGQPDRILWVRLEDGTLRAMTYERAEQVIAWHRQDLGGTDVSVESIAVIPDPTAVRDELWLVVARTVNSATVRYVERLEAAWTGEDAIEDSYFVDCGLSYSGGAVSTVSGLEHLEGESVAVLADGLATTATVSGGAITLASSASDIHVGLSYNADIVTQTLEAGAGNGVAAGKIQRITSVIFRLWETGKGLTFGPSLASVSRGTLPATAGALTTGDSALIPWEAGNERGSAIAIRHATPLPCTVVAVFPSMETQEA